MFLCPLNTSQTLGCYPGAAKEPQRVARNDLLAKQKYTSGCEVDRWLQADFIEAVGAWHFTTQ
jgi:hypothetical protein